MKAMIKNWKWRRCIFNNIKFAYMTREARKFMGSWCLRDNAVRIFKARNLQNASIYIVISHFLRLNSRCHLIKTHSLIMNFMTSPEPVLSSEAAEKTVLMCHVLISDLFKFVTRAATANSVMISLLCLQWHERTLLLCVCRNRSAEI